MIIVSLMLCVAQVASAGQLEDSRTAYERGDYAHNICALMQERHGLYETASLPPNSKLRT